MLKDNKQFRPWVFLAFYFLVVYWVIFFLPFSIFSVPQLSPIQSVEFIASDASKPSAIDNAQWTAISLPDYWVNNHQNVDSIWYRSAPNLAEIKDDIWAVYLPSVTHNAAVFINGVWVGQGGQFTAPVSRHHNDPLLFQFSSDLLKPGVNEVTIRVKTAFYAQGLLDEFYLAPAASLIDAYTFKHFIRVDLIQWFSWFMMLASLLLILFWLARPQDKIYAYYALLLGLWAVHNLNLFVHQIPISAQYWEAMTMSTLGWTVVMMIVFNHRYLGHINKRIENLIILFAILGVGIFLLPDIENILLIGYAVWDLFVFLFGIYALYFLMHTYHQYQSHDAYLLMLVGIPVLAMGLHDVLVVNHLIDRREGLIIQYGGFSAVILFSWFLVRRFLKSINKAEQLAATLEQRVKVKQKSLEVQYHQLNEFEKQSVLTKERERIMRDMHDGIGGQLISIVTLLIEYDDKILVKIREKIKLSISDLRFVIDSLDPLLNDFPTLLGTMRMRLSEQLLAADIKLLWGITDLPEVDPLTPSQSLHIMRIVQEAVTNSIKHSATTKLMVATGELESQDISSHQSLIYVDVIDYAQGNAKIDKTVLTSSRGLSNMKYRAEKLNADLEVSFLDSGTKVRLVLKMNRLKEE